MSAIHMSKLVGLGTGMLFVPGIALGASLPVRPLPERSEVTRPAFVQEGDVSDALDIKKFDGKATTINAPPLNRIADLSVPMSGAAPSHDARRVMVTKLAVLAPPHRVSNEELSAMRGGFFVAAGANFDFGASIRTLVNGQLALQTNLTWTPQGVSIQELTGLGQSIQSQVQAQVQSSLANAGIATGAPAANGMVNGAGSSTNGVTQPPPNAVAQPAVNVATQPTVNTPTAPLATAGTSLPSGATTVSAASGTQPIASGAPVTLSIPALMSGVTIPGATGGSTQVYANLSNNQIQSIILNSASNQTISQNTNVNLTIYNLPQWQQQLAQHALSSQLVHEVLAATGLGR